MKQLSYIISLGFRTLIFALVFGSIVLQPLVESMSVSESQVFSWLDLETENDTSEKETKELKDTKNKKVELRFVIEETAKDVSLKKPSIFWNDYLISEVTIDTHDPPPEEA